MMSKKSHKAFTLIEVLIVIAIIGLLTTIVLVSITSTRSKARDNRRMAELLTLGKSLEFYYSEHGQYPESADWIKVEENATFTTAMAPYISRTPEDPSYNPANEYSYQYTTETTGGLEYKACATMETYEDPYCISSVFGGSIVFDGGGSGEISGWTQTINPSTGWDTASAVVLDNNNLYVVGCDKAIGSPQWRIEKRDLLTGSLSTDFGIGGVVVSDPSEANADEKAKAVTLDSDNMYVVGWQVYSSSYYWRIEKRDINTGSLIPEFGTDGVVISGYTNMATAIGDLDIAIDGTGIYITGRDQGGGGGQWRIEKRDLVNGDLISGFGSGGIVTVNPSTKIDHSQVITIDDNGIYVGGFEYIEETDPYNYQWRVEKRDLITGSLIISFGDNGVVTSDPSSYTGLEYLWAIELDGNNLYLVGDDYSPGNRQWRIEKRSLVSGDLIADFGVNGVIQINPSANNDSPAGIALDNDSVYVIGSDLFFSSTDSQWRIEKRDIITGALISDFGTNGIITNNPSANYDWLEAITIDSAAIYIVGNDASPGDKQWRMEKRCLIDGGQ